MLLRPDAGQARFVIELDCAAQRADGDVGDVLGERLGRGHGLGAILQQDLAQPGGGLLDLLDVDAGHIPLGLARDRRPRSRPSRCGPLVELGDDDDQGAFVLGPLRQPRMPPDPRRRLVEDGLLAAQQPAALRRAWRVAGSTDRAEPLDLASGRTKTGSPATAPGAASPGSRPCPVPAGSARRRCRRGRASATAAPGRRRGAPPGAGS